MLMALRKNNIIYVSLSTFAKERTKNQPISRLVRQHLHHSVYMPARSPGCWPCSCAVQCRRCCFRETSILAWRRRRLLSNSHYLLHHRHLTFRPPSAYHPSLFACFGCRTMGFCTVQQHYATRLSRASLYRYNCVWCVRKMKKYTIKKTDIEVYHHFHLPHSLIDCRTWSTWAGRHASLLVCTTLGWAERTTPERHPWRTTSRTVLYVPYTCPVRPVQLGQFPHYICNVFIVLYLANHIRILTCLAWKCTKFTHTNFLIDSDTCSRQWCREPRAKIDLNATW